MKTLIILGLILAVFTTEGLSRKLLIARGEFDPPIPYNKVEILDLDDPKQSKVVSDYPKKSFRGQGWLDPTDSQPILCGGEARAECGDLNCYKYSVHADKWTVLPNQPKKKTWSSTYLNITGIGAVIFGGGVTKCHRDDRGRCGCSLTDTTQIYNFHTKQWNRNNYGPKLEYDFDGCVAQIDNQTTFIGYRFGTKSYNWQTQTFKTLSNLPDHRWSKMMCAYDEQSGQVVLAGGVSGMDITDLVWLYNPLTDSYKFGHQLPFKTAGGALTKVGNELIFSGGGLSDPFKNSKNLYRYSAKKGWIKLNITMKYGRSYHNVIALNE